MLPVLQARESLRHVAEFVLANSDDKKNRSAANLRKQWTREAEVNKRTVGVDLNVMDSGARQAFIESLGFKVE